MHFDFDMDLDMAPVIGTAGRVLQNVESGSSRDVRLVVQFTRIEEITAQTAVGGSWRSVHDPLC